jgi:hypothetical protein
MTVKTVNSEVTVTYKTARGKDATLTIPVTQVTELTDALLAARKEAYAHQRAEKTAARAEAQAQRAAKKQARTAKATARKAERVAKLKAQLAELEA